MHPSRSANSDAAVIRDVLAGERDKFAEIVQRHQSALLRAAASRLGRRDWAEDVVQETFLWAFKCLKSYDSRYSFRTWLWTILWNQCNRHYQKRARRPTVNLSSEWFTESGFRGLTDSMPALDDTPPARLLAKERSEQLDASLRRLPDAQANALRLRFFGALKFHEIADVMDCGLSTAKNRVRNGLLKLGKMISESEFTCDSSTGDAT